MVDYNKLDDAIIEEDEERYNSQFKQRETKKGPASEITLGLGSADAAGPRSKTACCSIF